MREEYDSIDGPHDEFSPKKAPRFKLFCIFAGLIILIGRGNKRINILLLYLNFK